MSAPDARWIRWRAETHVARWPCTEAHLIQVLERGFQRALARHAGGDERPPLLPEHRAWVRDEVARLVAAGHVDDWRWGRDAAAALLRKGHAPRAIAERLRQKGLPAAISSVVLAELNEGGSPVGRAAAAYVRKRRLGPCREKSLPAAEARAERQRDLARLARRGVDFDTARRVLDLPDADAVRAVELGHATLDG